jgi:catechol 2,3-dioxygenase-like lactoylglutathione lyase family enzyme
MILQVHHIQISIPIGKETEARAFYGDVLGLKEIPKHDAAARGGLWFQLANAQLHVGVEDGVDRAKTKGHVAYQVRDLGELKLLLAKNGIETKPSSLIPGYDRCECRDPFGNRIEFTQVLG